MFFSSSQTDLSAKIAALLAKTFGISDKALIQVNASSTKPTINGNETPSNDQSYEVRLPFVANSVWAEAEQNIKKSLNIKGEIKKSYNIPIFDSKQAPLANVKNIIAVSSGKGGVGKSASALNLAIALKLEGARVGILDADIYGPSIPIMLGTQDQAPQSADNKHMSPIVAHDLVSNSIGYLVKNDHASIWRGPMASKALQQLATETRWPILDYLIVDMPPGTGDIQLTMCQQLPISAAVIVSTPQDIALSDAAKGIAMFKQLKVPVLGIIENMSYFECGHCHQKTAIFSEKGAQKLSDKYALPLLAQVPLDPIIREFADNGRSLLHEQAEHPISIIYRQAAIDLSLQLCERSEVSRLASNAADNIEVTRLD